MREIRAKNRALTNRMQAELDKFTDPEALEQHLWEHTFFLTHSVIKSDGMHDR